MFFEEEQFLMDNSEVFWYFAMELVRLKYDTNNSKTVNISR